MPASHPSPTSATDPSAPDDGVSIPSGQVLMSPSLPLVAGAFAAGVFLATRPGRHLTRGAIRTVLLLVKPALLVGGLLKLREVTRRPSPSPHSPPS